METPLTDPIILRSEFERCWPWLDEALEFGAFMHEGKLWKTHDKQHVWDKIARGWSFFWPGKRSAIVTQFWVSPTGLKTHHTWLSGGNLDEIIEMTPVIEAWGKKRGCHVQRGDGRRGWLGVLDGYREVGVHREKSLIG